MKKRKLTLPLKIVAVLSILLAIVIPSVTGLTRTFAQGDGNQLKLTTETDLENQKIGYGIILNIEDSRDVKDIITKTNSSLPTPSIDSSFEKQLETATVKRQWKMIVPEGLSFDEKAEKDLILEEDPNAEIPVFDYDKETRELTIEVDGSTQKTILLLIIDEAKKYELSISDANLPVTSEKLEFTVKGNVDPADFLSNGTFENKASASAMTSVGSTETTPVSNIEGSKDGIRTEAYDRLSPYAGGPQLILLDAYLINITQGVQTINQTTHRPYVNGGDVLAYVTNYSNVSGTSQYLSYLQFYYLSDMFDHNRVDEITGSATVNNVAIPTSTTVEGEVLRLNINLNIPVNTTLQSIIYGQLLKVTTNSDYSPGRTLSWNYTLNNDNGYIFGTNLFYKFNSERLLPNISSVVSSNGNQLDMTSTSLPTDPMNYLTSGDTAKFSVTSQVIDDSQATASGFPATNIIYNGQVDPTIFDTTSGLSNLSVNVGGVVITGSSASISPDGLVTITLPETQTINSGQSLTVDFELQSLSSKANDERTYLTSSVSVQSTTGIQYYSPETTTQFWYKYQEKQELNLTVNPVSDNKTDIDGLGNPIIDVSGKTISGSTGVSNAYVLLFQDTNLIGENPSNVIPGTSTLYSVQADANGDYTYDIENSTVDLIATNKITVTAFSNDSSSATTETIVVDRTAPTGASVKVTVGINDAKPSYSDFLAANSLFDTNPTVSAADISITYASGNDEVNNWITNNGERPVSGTHRFNLYLTDPAGNSRLVEVELEILATATVTIEFVEIGTNRPLQTEAVLSGDVGSTINIWENPIIQTAIDLVDSEYVLIDRPSSDTNFTFQSVNPTLYYYFDRGLYLKTAPATIEFGLQNTLNYGELTVRDFDYGNTPLVVTDNRPTSNNYWRLTATLTQAFTSENTPNQILYDALWYKNDTGEQLMELNQSVDLLTNDQANKGDYNVSSAEWDTKPNGFIFKLESTDYRELDDYNASITYRLLDAP